MNSAGPPQSLSEVFDTWYSPLHDVALDRLGKERKPGGSKSKLSMEARDVFQRKEHHLIRENDFTANGSLRITFSRARGLVKQSVNGWND